MADVKFVVSMKCKSPDYFDCDCVKVVDDKPDSTVFQFTGFLRSVMPKTLHQNLLMCLSDAIVCRFNELLEKEDKK